MPAHDVNGWRNFCRACERIYWAEWHGHTGRVTRLELDEETPHRCEPKEEKS